MQRRRFARIAIVLVVAGAAGYLAFVASLRRTAPHALERAARHLQNEQPAQARAALGWLLWADPSHSGAWHLSGMSYLQENNIPAAIAALEKVSEDFDQARDARVQLAGVLIADRQLDRGEAVLRKVLVAHPDSLMAARLLSGLYLTELRQREAVQVLEDFLKASETTLSAPDRLLMLRDLATAEFHPPSPKSCRPTLREAVDQHPDQPAVCLALGQCEADAGNRAAAATRLRDAVNQRPDDVRFRQVLSGFLLESGEIEAAETELRAIPQSVLEGDDQAAELLCRVAEQRGEYEAALQHCQRAIALRPHVKEYETRRARLLQRLGRAEDATRAYARAHELSQAELALWSLSRDLATGTPNPEECDRMAEGYDVLDKTIQARGWRSLKEPASG